MEALDRLSHAIEQDAAYGPALALSAWCHMVLYNNGWTDDPEATRQKAISLARRAVRSAGDDAETLGRAAYVLAYCGEDIDAPTALIDRSLQINPSFAYGWQWSGWLRLWAGSPDVAIDHIERSLRLDPRDSNGAALAVNGIAHFFARRLDQARTMLWLSLQQYPDWVPTNRFLAACYAHRGQLDEAKIIIKRLRALTPVVLPKADHWRDPEIARVLPIGPAAGDQCDGIRWPRRPSASIVADRKGLLPANPPATFAVSIKKWLEAARPRGSGAFG
jgi:tetratricopeptide (TPR) repeat protein